MPTARLGSDPNGVVQNASQGFGGAARQAIVNAGEKLTNLNGGGSLDLSRRRIQSPKRARRAVSEVRTVPANPFENTGNSAPCKGVSVVRKGDDGGGNATAIEPSLTFRRPAHILQEDLGCDHWPKPMLQAMSPLFAAASSWHPPQPSGFGYERRTVPKAKPPTPTACIQE